MKGKIRFKNKKFKIFFKNKIVSPMVNVVKLVETHIFLPSDYLN